MCSKLHTHINCRKRNVMTTNWEFIFYSMKNGKVFVGKCFKTIYDFFCTFWGISAHCAPFWGQKTWKSAIWGCRSSWNAKTLLPSKFQLNRMKIEVLLHFGGLRPTVPHFWVKKRELGLPIFIKCKNAPTHQVSAKSDENWGFITFWGISARCAPFWG